MLDKFLHSSFKFGKGFSVVLLMLLIVVMIFSATDLIISNKNEFKAPEFSYALELTRINSKNLNEARQQKMLEEEQALIKQKYSNLINDIIEKNKLPKELSDKIVALFAYYRFHPQYKEYADEHIVAFTKFLSDSFKHKFGDVAPNLKEAANHFILTADLYGFFVESNLT